jgi:hypothetical protein
LAKHNVAYYHHKPQPHSNNYWHYCSHKQLDNHYALNCPTHIEKTYLVYTILNPLNVVGLSKGDFGKADIKVSLLNKKIFVILYPSKLMMRKYRTILREFKKVKNGEYKYEESF